MATINLGNLTFTHKGDYAGGTAYVKNDVVYYATNGNSYIAKTSTTGNAPTSTAHWDIFVAGASGIWNAGLSLGSANQVVKVNSGATALEFGAMDSGKTLGITKFTNSTRTSLPNQDTYNFFDTNYTQIKANSKIRVDIHLIGFTNDNGTVNFDLEYDGTTYSGEAIYAYTAQSYPHIISGIYYINGASTTGAKNFKFQYDHATSNGRPFAIWNPNASDDNRLQQCKSNIIFTEYDF